MVTLIHHIRKIILLFSLTLAVVIYLYVTSNYTSENLERIRLGQYYALTATVYLFVALLASPLYAVFPKFPYKPIYIRARRAIGVSAFFFATLHGSIEFFLLLGGFDGLSLLPQSYLKAITYSFTAYLILATMTSTSLDYAVKTLGSKWKIIHRFVYLAAFLIGIHALMLGTNFVDLSGIIPKVYFAALALLLVLEAIRFDRFLASRFSLNFSFGICLIVVIGALTYASIYLKAPETGTSSSLGIHANHTKIAQEAQKESTSSLPNLPGLTGDRTKRYSVSFEHEQVVPTGAATQLTFKVYDAANGNPVSLYKKPYEETFHLIIVDSSLSHFEHIHPKQSGNTFSITTTFPTESVYHLYTDFQPLEAIDQQYAFSLKVGSDSSKATQPLDSNLTKVFGDYEVTFSSDRPLSAYEMSLGKQKISFEIKDAKTKKPITDLKPYLNSFGHLVMIHQERYDYLHVHPFSLTAPAPNSNGGPKVDFLPIGIYGKFEPGIYRAFGQFNHNGKIFVADFTVKVN